MAVTKLHVLLFTRGNKLKTSRKKKISSKKDMQSREHRKFSSCILQRNFSFSLIRFYNKNNAISKNVIEGETIKTPLKSMKPPVCLNF